MGKGVWRQSLCDAVRTLLVPDKTVFLFGFTVSQQVILYKTLFFQNRATPEPGMLS